MNDCWCRLKWWQWRSHTQMDFSTSFLLRTSTTFVVQVWYVFVYLIRKEANMMSEFSFILINVTSKEKECETWYSLVAGDVGTFFSMAEKQKIILKELEGIRAGEMDAHIPGYEQHRLYPGKSISRDIAELYCLHLFYESYMYMYVLYIAVYKVNPYNRNMHPWSLNSINVI